MNCAALSALIQETIMPEDLVSIIEQINLVAPSVSHGCT